MSNNKEERIYKDSVHLFLALKREGTAKDKRCIRHVIKRDEKEELRVLEAKLKAINGTWRIYKTVNARNVNKAMKLLMKKLIDHPEKASCIDTEWRTALLQRECKETNYFMFDVDTKETDKILKIINILAKHKALAGNNSIIESPKGFHYITKKFDTREICKLDYVTLLRDGYYYIKTVNTDNHE